MPMMYHEAASQAVTMMTIAMEKETSDNRSRPMKLAKRPNGGRPVAAKTKSERRTA